MTEPLQQRVLAYLRRHQVLTLATDGPQGLWAAAVFYANDGFDFFFLSAGHTRHSQNLAANPWAAGTIQEDYRDWPAIKGIQLEGSIAQLQGEQRAAAIAIYQDKYPFIAGADEKMQAALERVSWYCLQPQRLYFIDNSRGLGHRDEVPLDVSRGNIDLMSRADQRRWDDRWQRRGPLSPPHPLLQRARPWLASGRALDLACGRGRHGLWLAERGYQVLAVDISPTALRAGAAEARRLQLTGRIAFVQVDLDEWPLPEKGFDLLCCIRFLDRRLWPAIGRSLRPGGLLIYSTRHTGFLQRVPTATPDFLLQPGELVRQFAGWQILFEEEGIEDAGLIARRPQD